MDLPLYVGPASFRVPAHVLVEALAYTAGFALYRAERRRRGDVVDDHARWALIAAAAVGAALGSRLPLWLAELPQLLAGTLSLAAWYGRKTIVGALLGGLVSVELVKRRIGVTRATGDLFALPLAVAIAIGRVGCLLGGLEDGTHGLPSSLPWAIDLGDGVPRHPAPLYEMLFLAPLAALLVRARRGAGADGAAREGDGFKLFLAAYLAFRLVADFLKPRAPLLGLDPIQWCCVGGLLYYLPHLPRLARLAVTPRRAGTPAP